MTLPVAPPQKLLTVPAPGPQNAVVSTPAVSRISSFWLSL